MRCIAIVSSFTPTTSSEIVHVYSFFFVHFAVGEREYERNERSRHTNIVKHRNELNVESDNAFKIIMTSLELVSEVLLARVHSMTKRGANISKSQTNSNRYIPCLEHQLVGLEHLDEIDKGHSTYKTDCSGKEK